MECCHGKMRSAKAMNEILPGLPDDTRVFIYGFERSLSAGEQKDLGDQVEKFLSGWTSHETEVTSGYQMLYDRFLILGAVTGLSGCSIDKSVHLMQEIRDSKGLNALNYDMVFYKNGGSVGAVTRAKFEDLTRKKSVSSETIVFNNTIQNLGDVRTGKWETEAGNSWHARAFFE